MKLKTIALISGLALLSAGAHANPFLKDKWPHTDFTRSTVDISEVISGGPPKDGIPAIDAPRFDSIARAGEWLQPREPVIVLHLHEQARAYPLQLLIYHEIVNDRIDDTPFSVTFCPLCNSSVVFDRRVDGRVLDFGTTGMLRRSDMVMYDRQTESWWQQIIGEGIVGEYAGVRLQQLPSSIVSFEDFASAYPGGKVLNRTTGYTRSYGSNPYLGYDDIDQTPFLFRGTVDSRLPPMERVIHIRIDGEEKIYPFSSLGNLAVLNDSLADRGIVLFSRKGLLSVLDQALISESRSIQAVTAFEREIQGQLLEFEIRDGRVLDRQTGSTWNLLGEAVSGPLKGSVLKPAMSGIHFAFAWLAFNPEVEIYSAER